MGTNSNKFDHEAYYASKSTKELEAMLKKAQEFGQKYPVANNSIHNEYVQTLKLKIAERIGKK